MVLPPRVRRRGPDGLPLFIDIAYLRGDGLADAEVPDRAFLHSSGTHGVEGFVGSAVQVRLLTEAAAGRRPELTPPPRGMTVLIHAVNPFGFAWNRRFSPTNCDLNRNWLVPSSFEEQAAAGLPALFHAYRDLIAPDAVPDPTSWSEWAWTRARAGLAIALHGLDSLKAAVAAGHRVLPSAMYFGGTELQQEPLLIMAGLEAVGMLQRAPPASRALAAAAEAARPAWAPWAAADAAGIWEGLRGPGSLVSVDVHSGLGLPGQSSLLLSGSGPRGKEASFVRRAVGVESHDATVPLKRAVVQDACASGSSGVAYEIRGGFAEALAAVPGPEAGAGEPFAGLGAEDRVCVVQEFGTVPPTSVFFALRAESALHRERPGAPPSHPLRQALLRAFLPEDAAWRRECLSQGEAVAARLAASVFR